MVCGFVAYGECVLTARANRHNLQEYLVCRRRHTVKRHTVSPAHFFYGTQIIAHRQHSVSHLSTYRLIQCPVVSAVATAAAYSKWMKLIQFKRTKMHWTSHRGKTIGSFLTLGTKSHPKEIWNPLKFSRTVNVNKYAKRRIFSCIWSNNMLPNNSLIVVSCIVGLYYISFPLLIHSYLVVVVGPFCLIHSWF